MELDWPVSLGILAAIAALSAFAIWRLRQPPDPLRIPMIDYHYVLLFALIAGFHFPA